MKIETKIKAQKPKVKLIGSEEDSPVSGLRDMDSNFVVNLLEENIELRKTPIEARIRKKLSGDKAKSLNIQQ
jgi:hypothetical protein